MSYEVSVKHEWADEAKTIVKRTVVDYPANLTELQTAVDQANARIITLPLPGSYPTQAEYVEKWADTGLSYEDVCRVIDQRNMDNPDVQEWIQLEVMVVEIQTCIADWRVKVGG